MVFLLLSAAAAFVVWESLEEHDHHRAAPTSRSEGVLDPHSPAAQAASTALFAAIRAAETFTLANGLQVVVIPDATSTEVANIVFYKTGGADDPAGKSGLAHFVEHLTFAETRGHSERPFFDTLERLGEKQDAFTTYDFTVYYQLVPPNQLEAVLGVEAHRMGKLRLETVSLAAERRELLDERREVEANPESLLDQQMRPVLYRDHPYGKPVLGWPHEFSKLSAMDATSFYRQRYGPNNAVAILYGPIQPALARSLAEKHLGAIPARTLAARSIPPAVLPNVAAPVIIKNRSIPESIWKRDYLAPSYRAGTTEKAYALQLLAEILGGGPESRLHHGLVERTKLARWISVHYDPESADLSTFSIVVAAQPGANFGDIAKLVELELQGLVIRHLSTPQLAHAKQDLKTRVAFTDEKMPAAARLAGEALIRGRTIHDVKEWPSRIDAVTGEQLRSAAQTLVATASVTGVLLGADRPRDP